MPKELEFKQLNKKIRRLIERDGPQCWLCGFDVRFISGNHPLTPTRDHVVQKRHGGTYTFDNTKLAHKFCNEKRDWIDGKSRMYQDHQTKIFLKCLGELS